MIREDVAWNILDIESEHIVAKRAGEVDDDHTQGIAHVGSIVEEVAYTFPLIYNHFFILVPIFFDSKP